MTVGIIENESLENCIMKFKQLCSVMNVNGSLMKQGNIPMKMVTASIKIFLWLKLKQLKCWATYTLKYFINYYNLGAETSGFSKNKKELL